MNAIIETTGTQTKVDLIATETLGYGTNATQAGRLGLELSIPANRANDVAEALRGAGERTIVTMPKP